MLTRRGALREIAIVYKRPLAYLCRAATDQASVDAGGASGAILGWVEKGGARDMREARRSTALVALAALVPLVLLGVLLLAGAFHNARVQAEQTTLARAQKLNALIDDEFMIDRGALLVLAGSDSILSRNWSAARSRALAVQQQRPTWRNVVMTAAATGTPIWQTVETPLAGESLSTSITDFLGSGETAAIGGTETANDLCRCISMHHLVRIGTEQFVLSVQRDVSDIQSLLLETVEQSEVGAVVDRNGLFIARSLDLESRFGKPATQYVRDAVSRGGSAIYEGVTYEELRNHTAYATSLASGWSSHIAVPATRFELLGVGSVGSAILAVAAALVFAGVFVFYAFRDARSRRLAQRAQFQSQKLEALGHLSGTVAHDFNNLLAVIEACFRIIERHPLTENQRQAIAEGKFASEKGAALIQQLLGFAREKPIELTCVDLAEAVQECRGLISRSLGFQIDLEINLSGNIGHVTTNKDQLELALLNLATNARDAMPDGGQFIISVLPSPVRGYVDLVVKDNGPGMPEETAARVFEPYFTTKGEGKGTGLGLAQVHLLATQSGGSLYLETSPGKGAKFTLRLPACDPAGTPM